MIGAKAYQCVIFSYLYICLWQSPSVRGYHVTNELSIKLVNNDNNDYLKSSNDRFKRKVQFDWQKDEDQSSEEIASSEEQQYHDITSEQIEQEEAEEEVTIDLRPPRKLVDEADELTEIVRVTEATSIEQQEQPDKKFDLKSILWSNGYETTTKSRRHKITTRKFIPRNRLTTMSTTTAAIASQVSADVPKPIIQAIEGEMIDHIITEAIQSAPIPPYKENVPNRTAIASGQLESPVLISPEIMSVNEDKLRMYTLAKNQKYGVGKAKPKIITQILSQMEDEEYDGEQDATEISRELTTKFTTEKITPNLRDISPTRV